MAAPYRWIKLWFDVLDDPRTGPLTDADFRVWTGTLIMCGENRMRGWTELHRVAWRLRRDPAETDASLQRLAAAGLVAISECRLTVPQFRARQGGIARTAAYREKSPGVTVGVTASRETCDARGEERRGEKSTPLPPKGSGGGGEQNPETAEAAWTLVQRVLKQRKAGERLRDLLPAGVWACVEAIGVDEVTEPKQRGVTRAHFLRFYAAARKAAR